MTIHNDIDATTSQQIKLTLVRSSTGRIPKHKATLNAMGLKRIGQSAILPNNKATRGMVRLVNYLITVEEE